VPAPGSVSTLVAPLLRGVVPIVSMVNQHSMTTKAMKGLHFLATYITAPPSWILKTFCRALADPNWWAAMEEEYHILMNNNTWDLIGRPPRTNY
jgi:hypothetical protein